MTTIRLTTDPADAIVTLWLDTPGKPVNTCTSAFFDDLTAAANQLAHSRPAGLIVASAKPRSFCAGADLDDVIAMTPDRAHEFLRHGQAAYNALAALPVPTVAAVAGDCLGGGLELALACRYRIAADDPRIALGLPEVKLGLVPGWGGTQRLPRLIGLRAALPLMLTGKPLSPQQARTIGLVDNVASSDGLLDAARRLLLTPPAPRQPGRIDRLIAETPRLRQRLLATARRRTLDRTYGNYPAPLRLLDVLAVGLDGGTQAGLDAERDTLVDLLGGTVAQNLLRLFFLRRQAKRNVATRIPAPPHQVHRAAVIGAGTMGRGIAQVFLAAGLDVHLIDIDPATLDAARLQIERGLAADPTAVARLTTASDFNRLVQLDAIIEAVVEDPAVKRDVFERLGRAARPDALLASNTSSLSIADMAAAVPNPGRVVGLHFFNPVPRMPLAELIRAPQSDDQSLATAAALAVRAGKTVVLARDAPGFIINRILFPYLTEAMAMVEEGHDPAAVDEAVRRWGMPMGPLELLDEIGLDVSLDIHAVLRRAAVPMAPASLLQRMLDRGWRGRKSRRGFYAHEGKGRPTVNPDLGRHAQAQPTDREQTPWRVMLPMVNESARLLDDAVTDAPDDIDLATVLGLGFAPFRGGIIRFADSVGIPEIVRRLTDLAVRHGPRFTPAPRLTALAAAGRPLGHPAPAPLPSPAGRA